jgi:hypothetical protein
MTDLTGTNPTQPVLKNKPVITVSLKLNLTDQITTPEQSLTYLMYANTY